MPRHSAAAVSLVLLCSACAPGAHRASTAPTPGAAVVEQRTRVVTVASSELREALESGNAAAVDSSLDPAVELVTMRRDTVRGREAAARLLLALAADEARPLRIFAGTVQPCSDGSVQEFGGAFTAPTSPGEPFGGFTQGTVAISWELAGDTAAVRRMDFSVPASRARRAGCALMYLATARSQRFVGTLALETAPVRPSGSTRAVNSGMQEHGFAYRPPQSWAAPFPKIQEAGGGLTAGLRYQLRFPFSTELQAGVRRTESVEGYESAKRRRLVVSTAPVTLTQLLQYQRGYLRLSAGPTVLLSNFTVHETHESFAYWGTEPRWYSMSEERTRERTRSPAAGVASELALVLPFAGRSLAELRLGYATYGGSRVPGTPHFPGMTVSGELASLAIAVGAGW